MKEPRPKTTDNERPAEEPNTVDEPSPVRPPKEPTPRHRTPDIDVEGS